MFSSTRAVEVQQPDGSTTLLAHLAHLVMPQRFPALVQQQQCTAAGSTSVQQVDEAGPAPAASSQQQLVAEQVAAAAADPLGALTLCTEPAAGTAAGSSSAPSPPAAAGDTAVLPQQCPASCSAVYVCGVQPDWCTPLAWLHEHMKAADGFLYVAVHLTA